MVGVTVLCRCHPICDVGLCKGEGVILMVIWGESAPIEGGRACISPQEMCCLVIVNWLASNGVCDDVIEAP